MTGNGGAVYILLEGPENIRFLKIFICGKTTIVNTNSKLQADKVICGSV